MTDDLVAFLRARLDEDEQAGRGAGSAPWRYNPAVRWPRPDTPGFEAVVSAGPSGQAIRIATTGEHGDPHGGARALHIVRHDPARVLAEIDAKRRIIDECAEVLARDDWEYTDAPELAELTLLTLASPFRSHAEFQERWTLPQ